jgi:hypothetical protein
MERKRATWFIPIDFQNDFFPFLSVVFYKYKIILGTCYSGKSVGEFSLFIEKWIKSKFDSTTDRINPTTGLTTLANLNCSKFHLLIKHLELSEEKSLRKVRKIIKSFFGSDYNFTA